MPNSNSIIQFKLNLFMNNKNNFKGMSWAEVSFAVDEEEERLIKEENERILGEQLAERRRLYALGKYELEDGEILE